MASYAELQTEHQRLLHLVDQGGDPAKLLAAVKAYVARVRSESPSIAAPRDRDQLRANMRFWGSWLFDKTGEYPDTTLRPAEVNADTVPLAGRPVTSPDFQPNTEPQTDLPPPPKSSPGYVTKAPASSRWSWVLAASGLLLVLVCLASTLALVTSFLPGSQGRQTPTTAASATSAPAGTELKPTGTGPATPLTPPTRAGTSIPPATQTPTQAGLPYRRLELLAQVSQEPGSAGCADRSLSIAVDSAGLLDPKQLGGGQVELTLAGGDSVATQPLSPDHNSIDLTQLGFDHDNTFLLRVEHPQLTFASVIIQFSPDCARNQATVHYVAQNAPSNLEREPARSPDLNLAWALMTWGPAPQAPRRWVAELKLTGEGGDGQFIFWDGSSYGPNTILLFSESVCNPDRRLAGVSSGGEAVLREIVLEAPVC